MNHFIKGKLHKLKYHKHVIRKRNTAKSCQRKLHLAMKFTIKQHRSAIKKDYARLIFYLFSIILS